VVARFAERGIPARTVRVEAGGHVAALNAGLDAAQAAIVAITDDDAVPRSDWLERIVRHFESDPALTGVGGRDLVYLRHRPVVASAARVGMVAPYGRVVGNHHIGRGGPRAVDVLKGVNMSFRRAHLDGARFDERLRGTGAQVHNDLAFSLQLRRRGCLLLYDPQVLVDHYPAQRHDEDQRDAFNPLALENASFNEALALLDYLRWPQRALYLGWAMIIGIGVAPGLLQGLRLLLRRDPDAIVKLRSATRGRMLGAAAWIRRR
jgi:cellulose synthase/poly-beta-1,6-N-acetylglucosamine synthase-like glycosyltransferase